MASTLTDNDKQWGNDLLRYSKPGCPEGKINLRTQVRLISHRSGWGQVVHLLEPYHNVRGAILDGFVERTWSSVRKVGKYTIH